MKTVRQVNSDTRPPRVDGAPVLSIGLAICNGAGHLRQSLDSLLAQDVVDLELIISDNASTDETPSICAEYASVDARVRYTRNQKNIGAAANFNRVFELCSGQFFMWGSDDDVWQPSFARLCIERLEMSPQASHCTSEISFIDQDGISLGDLGYRSIDTEGMTAEAKIHELISRLGWFGIYSVIRPQALRRTQGFAAAFGGDVVLLLELMLGGESLVVPRPLFSYRMPDQTKTAAEYLSAIGGADLTRGADGGTQRPYTDLARQLLGVVEASDLDPRIVSRIRADFINTLSIENLAWGARIMAEQGASLDAAESTDDTRLAIGAALGIGVPGLPYDASGRSTRQPWIPRSGMKLAALRSALLKLLQPFTERQNELDLKNAASVERLACEVDRLRRRVRALERGEASPGD
jgi:hypothetical protein